jgi:hypothetical protein
MLLQQKIGDLMPSAVVTMRHKPKIEGPKASVQAKAQLQPKTGGRAAFAQA